MSELYETRGTFIKANYSYLEAIREQIENLLQSQEDALIVQISDESSKIISGQITTNDLRGIDGYEDFSDSELSEKAAIDNDALLRVAKIRHYDLVALFLMTEFVENGLRDGLSDEDVSKLKIPDSVGRSIEYLFSDDTTLSQSTLIIEGAEVASMYRFSQDIGGIEEKISIYEHEGLIKNIQIITTPHTHSFIGEWIEKFDPQLSRLKDLFEILSGYYATDSELNMALSDLWIKFQETSLAPEIGPFLDRVREAVIAQREGQKLEVATTLGLPSVDKLNDIIISLSKI